MAATAVTGISLATRTTTTVVPSDTRQAPYEDETTVTSTEDVTDYSSLRLELRVDDIDRPSVAILHVIVETAMTNAGPWKYVGDFDDVQAPAQYHAARLGNAGVRKVFTGLQKFARLRAVIGPRGQERRSVTFGLSGEKV